MTSRPGNLDFTSGDGGITSISFVFSFFSLSFGAYFTGYPGSPIPVAFSLFSGDLSLTPVAISLLSGDLSSIPVI